MYSRWVLDGILKDSTTTCISINRFRSIPFSCILGAALVSILPLVFVALYSNQILGLLDVDHVKVVKRFGAI